MRLIVISCDLYVSVLYQYRLLKLLKTSLFLLGTTILLLGFTQSALAVDGGFTDTPPRMVDPFGHTISSFQVGQEIGVESTITNHGQSNQKYAYMVQVLGSNSETEYFESNSASLEPSQSFNALQVWIPTNSGQYTVQVFVWDSLSSAIPLTGVLSTTINVT
jgi:hypothetical protein